MVERPVADTAYFDLQGGADHACVSVFLRSHVDISRFQDLNRFYLRLQTVVKIQVGIDFRDKFVVAVLLVFEN